ncbi:hypothetical protein B0H19DRAFT_1065472 [Mycena capillaripes]|nr:hypothetical protein B0H19DRAFT_1065472 [Mycena capillaripes]
MRLAALLHLLYIAPLIFAAATPDAAGSEPDQLVTHSKRETNAERFRRGLGPLPPTRRDRNNLSPRASVVPCMHLSNNLGILEIRSVSDGNKIGYLGVRFNRQNAYTVHPRPRAALRVAVPPIAPFGVAITLIAANPPDSGHPYLVAVGNGQESLGLGEAGFAILSGGSSVRGHSPPSSSAGTSLTLNGHGGIESQIWTMNCETRRVTAQWTNADGGQPPTTIFYDPIRKFLGLTGDLQAFNAAVSEGAYAVVSSSSGLHADSINDPPDDGFCP